MPTKIEYQTWTGGEGLNDPRVLIGYCKEEPIEVLRYVYRTHLVHMYRGLYRPVEWDFPNNVAGLVISNATTAELAALGLAVSGIIEQFDLSVALTKNERNRDTYADAIADARRWYQNHYGDIIDEVESVTLGAEEVPHGR